MDSIDEKVATLSIDEPLDLQELARDLRGVISLLSGLICSPSEIEAEALAAIQKILAPWEDRALAAISAYEAAA